MRASLARALAISTICCWPMPSSLHRPVRVDVEADEGQRRAPRFAAHRVPADEAAAHRLAAEHQVLGHRQLGHQRQLLGDERDAVLLGVAQARKCDGLAVEQDLAAVGARRGSTPQRILMSVLLPAPFSPQSAWTSPFSQVEGDAVQGADARGTPW